MIYLHPVIGVLAITLMLWLGMQGLRSRHPRPYAPPARARHRRWAPRMVVGMVAVGLLGAVSTRLWRPDIDAGTTWHLRLGLALVAVLALTWVVSWRLPTGPTARVVHPLLGLLAMALGVGVGALGLGMLP